MCEEVEQDKPSDDIGKGLIKKGRTQQSGQGPHLGLVGEVRQIVFPMRDFGCVRKGAPNIDVDPLLLGRSGHALAVLNFFMRVMPASGRSKIQITSCLAE